MAWNYRIKIKYLFTDNEDHKSVQESMTAIADEIEKQLPWFANKLPLSKWRNIPQGDGTFAPVDYANRYLDRMYDLADEHRVWIG